MPPEEEDVWSIFDWNIFSPVAIVLGPEADAQAAHLRARRAAHAHVGRLLPLLHLSFGFSIMLGVLVLLSYAGLPRFASDCLRGPQIASDGRL